MWFVTGIISSSGMSDGLGRASGEFKHEYLFGKKFTDGYFRDVFKWSYHEPTRISTRPLKECVSKTGSRSLRMKKGWLGTAKSRAHIDAF